MKGRGMAIKDAYRSPLKTLVVLSSLVSADASRLFRQGRPARLFEHLGQGWLSSIRAVNWSIRPEALNRGSFRRKYLKHSLEVRGLQYLHES